VAVRIVIMLRLLTYRQLENCPRSRMEVRPTPLPSLLTLTLTFDLDLRLWFSIPDELMKTIATRNYRPIVFYRYCRLSDYQIFHTVVPTVIVTHVHAKIRGQRSKRFKRQRVNRRTQLILLPFSLTRSVPGTGKQ